MNKQDKERLARLLEIVKSIPKWQAGGTQSTAFDGYIGYSRDMSNFQELAELYLYNSLLESNWKNSPENGDIYNFEDEFPDFQSPDSILELMEKWIEKRKIEQWGLQR